MKLLLATDGSKFSDAAMQAVIAQVKRGETEVRVIHVVDTMYEPFPEMTAYDVQARHAPNLQRGPAEALVEATAELLRAKGLKATALVAWGDPRPKIIEAAKEWPADMIVLGSHGRTGIEAFLMGSVSDAVARHAPCSVEIVRTTKGRRLHQALRILLAVDDSACSDAAVNAVTTQFNPHGPEVKIIQVLEPFPVEAAEKIGTKNYPDFAAARLKLRDQAKQRLSKIAEGLVGAGFKATHLVEEGDPKDALLDQAGRWPADLIVVGSHGLRGVRRFLMGSVSEAVAHYAECSVEIVRVRSAD